MADRWMELVQGLGAPAADLVCRGTKEREKGKESAKTSSLIDGWSWCNVSGPPLRIWSAGAQEAGGEEGGGFEGPAESQVPTDGLSGAKASGWMDTAVKRFTETPMQEHLPQCRHCARDLAEGPNRAIEPEI